LPDASFAKADGATEGEGCQNLTERNMGVRQRQILETRRIKSQL